MHQPHPSPLYQGIFYGSVRLYYITSKTHLRNVVKTGLDRCLTIKTAEQNLLLFEYNFGQQRSGAFFIRSGRYLSSYSEKLQSGSQLQSSAFFSFINTPVSGASSHPGNKSKICRSLVHYFTPQRARHELANTAPSI